jgi:hypothetical protein
MRQSAKIVWLVGRGVPTEATLASEPAIHRDHLRRSRDQSRLQTVDENRRSRHETFRIAVLGRVRSRRNCIWKVGENAGKEGTFITPER